MVFIARLPLYEIYAENSYGQVSLLPLITASFVLSLNRQYHK